MIILTGIEIFVIVELAFETSMGGGPLDGYERLLVRPHNPRGANAGGRRAEEAEREDIYNTRRARAHARV